MKKHIITATAFAACLALCASVRPQSEPVEEIPVAQTQTAATAAEPQQTTAPAGVTEEENNDAMLAQ